MGPDRGEEFELQRDPPHGLSSGAVTDDAGGVQRLRP